MRRYLTASIIGLLGAADSNPWILSRIAIADSYGYTLTGGNCWTLVCSWAFIRVLGIRVILVSLRYRRITSFAIFITERVSAQ
jgi:hypothetical protein